MADMFDVLRRDHDEVKGILYELATDLTVEADLATTSGGEDALLGRRRDLAQRLVTESLKHEALEEDHFWPVFRALAPDGPRLAGQAVAQEEEARRLLTSLDSADPGQEGFGRLVSEIATKSREHIVFEERRAWPALAAVISDEQASELADAIEKGRWSGPTRPRRHTPAKPGVRRTAGAAATAPDRTRDKIGHRGR